MNSAGKSVMKSIIAFLLSLFVAANISAVLLPPKISIMTSDTLNQMFFHWTRSDSGVVYRLYSDTSPYGSFNTIAGSTTDTTLCLTVSPMVSRMFYRAVAAWPETTSWFSGPSNKVGYIRVQVNGSTTGAIYTALGFPFRFWHISSTGVPIWGDESFEPSDILYHQPNTGAVSTADLLIRQDNGMFAYRDSSTNGNWAGTLEVNHGARPGRAYWYCNRSGANKILYVAGEVCNVCNSYDDTVIVVAPVTSGTAYTPYIWASCGDFSRDQLELLTNGFTSGTSTTSDKVQNEVGGTSFYRRASDATWQGTMTGISPGTVVWILNKHQGHPWTMRFRGTGTP
jgi:hypothetical protein